MDNMYNVIAINNDSKNPTYVTMFTESVDIKTARNFVSTLSESKDAKIIDEGKIDLAIKKNNKLKGFTAE